MPPVHKKGALFAVHQDSPGPTVKQVHGHGHGHGVNHSSNSSAGVDAISMGRSIFGLKTNSSGADENAIPSFTGKQVQAKVMGRNVLGNKSNLIPMTGPATTNTKAIVKTLGGAGGKKRDSDVKMVSSREKENPVGNENAGNNKTRAKSTGLGSSAGLGLGLGMGVGENGSTMASKSNLGTTTTTAGQAHTHRRGKSGDQAKTIKSRLFGTNSSNHTANHTSHSNPATSAYLPSNARGNKDVDRAAGRSSTSGSSLINGLKNSPVRHLLGGRAGSSKANVLAGRAFSSASAPSSSTATAAINAATLPATAEVDDDEDVYSRPITRKQKKTVAQPPRSTVPDLVDDVFLPSARSNDMAQAKAPLLPYTSTFASPLQDAPQETPNPDFGGFALPAFPAPLTGGLFGPNKVVGAETRVKGLFGAPGRGKENVAPLGERVMDSATETAAGAVGTHRSLGSAFTFESIAEIPDRPLGMSTSPSPVKRRAFARSESREDGMATAGSIHGLGFGFTPCRASPIASTSASRRHQRGASSASGINHFLPHSHSAGSGLGDASESSFEKAKMTPLKQRSKKRASDKKSGSSGHRRGASSMSMTNHFLPAASSSDLVGRSIETSPMSRAKVTPLKSRRKHVRQKSSLSRGFSFGSNHVGLGFDMSAVDAPTETVEYGDEELGDMQSTPSVWESASSKRSSNTTSSLGSTSKRFWGLDVQAEDEEGERAEGFLTGSPISRRKSGSPSRTSLFVQQAILPSSVSTET